MEDIKILEEQLKTYKRHLENYEKEDCLTSTYYELKKYAGALENLIARNKELESALDNSVSKDEIKEKIEELETVTNSGGYPFIKKRNSSIQVEILQELLNKGE